jgi:hypothetical protein
VTRSNRREYITPILKELHWLPIQSRIQFKLGLIVFKALNNLAPSYLQDLLKIHQPLWCLRSASKNLLQEPRTITKKHMEIEHLGRLDQRFGIACLMN